MGPMPVTARPSTSTDLARNLAVAALAVIQIVVAGLGGSGALGEDVGTVARSYPTPVLSRPLAGRSASGA